MLEEKKSARIEMIDALRGLAIASIILLHNIEHFGLYYVPVSQFAWLNSLDQEISKISRFFIGGKTNGIFALLFGFTYYIQVSRQKEKGYDFSLRFLWRLSILLLFGMLNSLFFHADILTFNALLGIALLPVSKIGNRATLVIIAILLMQPLELFRLIMGGITSDFVAPQHTSEVYLLQLREHLTEGSLIEVLKNNLLIGKPAIYYWNLENGRIFQTPGLFLLGFSLAKTQRFHLNKQNQKFWKKIMLVSFSLSVLFVAINKGIDAMGSSGVYEHFALLAGAWLNLSVLILEVAFFIYLFNKGIAVNYLNKLSNLGRASLTNYVTQSIMGCFLYYGFGLSLYEHTGATFSILIGIALFAFQLYMSNWWFRRYKQGPLEYIWHKATWLGSSQKNKAKTVGKKLEEYRKDAVQSKLAV